MRSRTKYLIKNLAVKALWLMFGGFVIWANIVKLRNNDYSNYEKVIDYGRIKDEDKLIRPAIAAIFYQGKSDKKYPILIIAPIIKSKMYVWSWYLKIWPRIMRRW